jgi:hypothetical protein
MGISALQKTDSPDVREPKFAATFLQGLKSEIEEQYIISPSVEHSLWREEPAAMSIVDALLSNHVANAPSHTL